MVIYREYSLKNKKMNKLQQTHAAGAIAWVILIFFLGIETLSAIWIYYNVFITANNPATALIVILSTLLIGLALVWLWTGLMMLIINHINIQQPNLKKSFQYMGKRKGKPLFRIWFFFLPLWATKKEVDVIEGESIERLTKNYLGRFFFINKEGKASLADVS